MSSDKKICLVCAKPAINQISMIIENPGTLKTEPQYLCDKHMNELKLMRRKNAGNKDIGE